MDPIKKCKLRYLGLLSKIALLRIWCIWRTRIKPATSSQTQTKNPQMIKSTSEKKFMISQKPANNQKFIQKIENKLVIRPKLQQVNSFEEQNSTKKSIFEEIKASLKTKAKNSHFIPSPYKNHSDSLTEIPGCIIRARHKRSNTELIKLSTPESNKSSQSIYNLIAK